MTQPWLQTDFIKDIYLAIAKDADEQPTREGVEYLLEISRKSPTDQLQLRRARLGPTSTLQLSKRLEGVELATLDLFENAIKDVGFMALLKYAERHYTMKRINVGCCGITNEGAMALGEILKEGSGLEAVELGYPSGYIFQKVRKNINTALINQLTSESISFIAKNLAHNQTLKYLGLSHNLAGIGVSNEGPSQLGIMLSQNQTLTALDISYNLLQNTGATSIFRGLTQNIGLQKLTLNGNGITFLSIPILSNILSNLQCGLVELSLDDNPLGVEGAKALSYGLSQNQSLKKLSLNNCALDDDGVAIIAATLSHPIINNRDQLKSQFDLNNSVNATESLCDLMTDFFEKIVNKQQEEQGDKKIFVINHKGRVLSSTILKKIPKRNFSHSQQTNKLEDTLNFQQFLQENVQEDDAETSFGDETPQVDLETAIISDPQQTQTFPTNTVMAEFLGSTLTESHDDNFISQSSASGLIYSGITHLSLGYNNISVNGISYVSQLLKSCCQIHYLNLSGNKLQNNGAILIAETLIFNQICLRKFQTQPNFIPKLDKMDEVNSIITHLDFSKCSISDAGFVALAFSISVCSNMISLNFEENFVGEVGGQKGCTFLIKSYGMLQTNLRGNQVAHFSIQLLQQKLSENKSKITMNAPKRLKQRIIDMKSQSERLPICREELDFLMKSISIVQNHIASILTQKDDCNDQNYRQNQSLQLKSNQQIQQTEQVNDLIKEADLKCVSLEQKYTQQQEDNKQSILQTQTKFDETEKALVEQNNKNLEQIQLHQLELDNLKTAIEQEDSKIDFIKNQQILANKLIETLKIKYKDSINKALMGQVPIKMSIQFDFDQLAPSIKRMEKVANGATSINKITEYNVQMFDFTVPKQGKGKKGKSKKGKKLQRIL
ncbi:putative NOD3 protein [Spironucleus salmonicida]|uniref:NOD3 protein n=1 Tax=Spironucleus salmonicida TaxID=348837 RepID=V6LDZ2_9EUKA|nr:putative NOD3 protein [Spironucleus salmonicida]|eukprot:EST42682.1 hypothetical protein SS50377_17700 [Spironucleus salmonicida]